MPGPGGASPAGGKNIWELRRAPNPAPRQRRELRGCCPCFACPDFLPFSRLFPFPLPASWLQPQREAAPRRAQPGCGALGLAARGGLHGTPGNRGAPGIKGPSGSRGPPGNSLQPCHGAAHPPQPPNRCCPGGRASPAAPLPAPGRPPRAPTRTLKPPATFPGRLPSPRALVPLPGRFASPERCEANPASTRGCAAAGLTPRCRRRCGPPWSGAERIEPGGCRKGKEGEGGSSETPSPTSPAQAGGGSPGLSHWERLRAAGEAKKSRPPPARGTPLLCPAILGPRRCKTQRRQWESNAALQSPRSPDGSPSPAAGSPRRGPAARNAPHLSGEPGPDAAGSSLRPPSQGFPPPAPLQPRARAAALLAGLRRRCGPDGLCPLPGARRGQSPLAPSLSDPAAPLPSPPGPACPSRPSPLRPDGPPASPACGGAGGARTARLGLAAAAPAPRRAAGLGEQHINSGGWGGEGGGGQRQPAGAAAGQGQPRTPRTARRGTAPGPGEPRAGSGAERRGPGPGPGLRRLCKPVPQTGSRHRGDTAGELG